MHAQEVSVFRTKDCVMTISYIVLEDEIILEDETP